MLHKRGNSFEVQGVTCRRVETPANAKQRMTTQRELVQRHFTLPRPHPAAHSTDGHQETFTCPRPTHKVSTDQLITSALAWTVQVRHVCHTGHMPRALCLRGTKKGGSQQILKPGAPRPPSAHIGRKRWAGEAEDIAGRGLQQQGGGRNGERHTGTPRRSGQSWAEGGGVAVAMLLHGDLALEEMPTPAHAVKAIDKCQRKLILAIAAE